MYKLVPRPPIFKTGSTPLVVYMPNKQFNFFEFEYLCSLVVLPSLSRLLIPRRYGP